MDTNRGTGLDTPGRNVLAWLGLCLDGDEDDRALLHGDRPEVSRGKFARYVESP